MTKLYRHFGLICLVRKIIEIHVGTQFDELRNGKSFTLFELDQLNSSKAIMTECFILVGSAMFGATLNLVTRVGLL